MKQKKIQGTCIIKQVQVYINLKYLVVDAEEILAPSASKIGVLNTCNIGKNTSPQEIPK
jgi:hypothetical protein